MAAQVGTHNLIKAIRRKYYDNLEQKFISIGISEESKITFKPKIFYRWPDGVNMYD